MSLIREVKDTLLDWMRQGKYPAGSQLPSVPELVRRLGVSRTVVREMLQGLAAMNLVEMRPGLGCYVRWVSPDLVVNAEAMAPLLDIETLIEVAVARRAIEGGVARLAAQTATAADFEEMEDLIDSIAMLARKSRPMHEATPAFHVALARATHNKVLERVVASFNSLMASAGEVIEHAHAGSRYRSAEVASHRRLLNVLRLRDPERAQREMEDHVDKTINQLRSIRNKRRQSRPA